MRMNRSIGYGMIATAYVAMHSKENAILASKIAEEYDISLGFLLKIMQQLTRATILKSKKGPRGGFRMARPPEAINMLEIIEAIDGPMATQLELVQQTNSESFSIKMEKVCEDATERAKAILKKTKLSTMLT